MDCRPAGYYNTITSNMLPRGGLKVNSYLEHISPTSILCHCEKKYTLIFTTSFVIGIISLVFLGKKEITARTLRKSAVIS